MVLDKYKEELIEINLEKSEESLKAAEMMLSNNMLMTALNRTYYSIFYIVTALAKKYDFITSKHSTLKGWFHKNFIHDSKRFENEIYDIYKSAFEFRQKGDYDDVYKPDTEKVKELIEKAKTFIDTVKKEI